MRGVFFFTHTGPLRHQTRALRFSGLRRRTQEIQSTLTRRGRPIFSLHAIDMDRLSRKHKACRFVVDLVPAARASADVPGATGRS
jgi:hypothetical protein